MDPAAVFPATCAACGEATRFIEVRVEACLNPDDGPPKAWHGFRCMACGKKAREVAAPEGTHRFADGRHIVDSDGARTEA